MVNEELVPKTESLMKYFALMVQLEKFIGYFKSGNSLQGISKFQKIAV